MSGARITPLKRLFTSAGAVVVVLVLAACGARIDTQLNVDTSGAGSRVMTLTLEENQDSLVGGTAALDASILRHKPAEVDYSGLTTGPNGALVATFTVPFANPGEYEQKMIALLAASDQQWTDQNAFVVEQSRFIQGATIEETFTSQNLMQWMFSGLLVDGVVAESDETNMYEVGSTTVTWDGVAHETGYAVSFSKVVDRGFDSVKMATTLADEDYSRLITYWVDDKAVYNAAKDVFDGFFAEVEASGATVDQDSEQVGITWTAALSASSPERLVELTNAALLSEETAFAVTTGPVEDDPATSSLTLVDYAECASICSPQAPTMTETLSVPAGFELVTGGQQQEDGTVLFTMSSSAAEQEFRAVHMFESVNTELSAGLTGGLTWTGQFTADAQSVAAVGEGFETLLTPTQDSGELAVEKIDDGTVYTVTITGADADGFATAFGAWSGSQTPAIAVISLPGASIFSINQRISGELALPSLVAQHMQAADVEHSLLLPFGQSFDTTSPVMPQGATIDGSRMTLDGQSGASFSVTVTGTTPIAYAAYAVLALALLGISVLALLMRKQIVATIARRRETRAELAARQSPAAESAGPVGEGPEPSGVRAGPAVHVASQSTVVEVPGPRPATATQGPFVATGAGARTEDDVDLL